MLILKILGGLVALGIGLYLGMAGRYEADPSELERALGPGGRTRKVKRSFTPLGWLRQRQERSSHARRRGGSGRHFSLVAPESQEERDRKKGTPGK
ncbi:MAG: hypothetical protein R6T96_14675 [Longimicrobiales bacterium]